MVATPLRSAGPVSGSVAAHQTFKHNRVAQAAFLGPTVHGENAY